MTWGSDRVAVQHCGGDTNAPNLPTSYAATPIKTSQIARKPVTKSILGDWAWFPIAPFGIPGARGTTSQANLGSPCYGATCT